MRELSITQRAADRSVEHRRAFTVIDDHIDPTPTRVGVDSRATDVEITIRPAGRIISVRR